MVWKKDKDEKPDARQQPQGAGRGHRAFLATGAALVAAAPAAAEAQDFLVGSSAEFAAALQAMAADPSSNHTIKITKSFDMSAPVAPIIAKPGATITIDGQGFTINGASAFRPFFVYSGNVDISNLTIANAAALGGDGAGGGMGAGGGLFVNEGATVRIADVAFIDNSAVGGDGSTWRPQGTVVSDAYLGGGGGLGGDGGASHLGGGGGLYGDGGDSRTIDSEIREDESGGGGGGALGDGGRSGIQYGGGGGGGFNFGGGQGDPTVEEGGGADHGGGGGGFSGAGGDATLTAVGAGGKEGGGTGGTGNAAAPDPPSTPGQDGGMFGGGGGGAGDSSSSASTADARGAGGDGGFGGGGGGAGGERYDPQDDPGWFGDGHAYADLNDGGAGGVFGGGGGADAGRGGAGGDFGGGGGSDGLDGGDGGYGGGGGGGAVRHLATPDWPMAGEGGAGGFGGGRGYGAGDRFNTGFGGGAASTVIPDPVAGRTGPNIEAHGGGGAGFGGAIFVRSGGNLIIGEGVSFAGGSVAGGQGGGGDATAGMAGGGGVFIQSGNLNFNIAGEGTTRVSDAIADATGNGADSGALIKDGAGTLVLSGANTYSGGTLIAGGTIRVESNSAFGTGAVTTKGSTIDYGSGVTIANSIVLSSNPNLNVGVGTATQAGDISQSGGVFGIAKTGEGTLVLSGTNTFTGATNVHGGTLTLAGGSALADVSAVNVSQGATLALADSETIGSLAGAGNVALGANVLTTGGAGASTVFAGAISGTGGLSTIGKGGVLTLSGINTFTGATHVLGGTLVLSGGSALSDVSAVSVSAGGLLLVNDSETIGSLAGDGAVNIGAKLLTIGGDGTSTSFSGLISGAAGVVKIGEGTLTLSGANTYSGGTTIAGGTIRVENNSAFGKGAVTTTGSTIDYADAITIANSIVLMSNPNLNVDVGSATQSGAISESGGVHGIVKTGAGALVLSGVNTFTGATSINEGTLTLAGELALSDISAVQISAGGTLELQDNEAIGSLSGLGDVRLNANTLTTGAASADTTFGGVIAGAGGLVKLGAGTLTLTGANTYSGPTKIDAGTLALSGGAALSDQNAVFVASGANLLLNDSEIIGSLAGAGQVKLGAHTLTTGGDGTSTEFSGVIDGAGGLVKVGAGSLTLSGASTFTGGVDVTAGTLALWGGAALSDATAVDVSLGATLALGDSEAIGSLAGAGSVNLGASLLSVGADGSSTTFSGVVFGGGALAKVGAGTFTLSGANTYTGPTFIQEGTLIASGGAAISDASYVSVATAGVFELGANETIGGLEGEGQVILGANVLTVGGGDTSSAFLGIISGTGDLTKIGTGTFALTGPNTFSGSTIVSGGQLALLGGAALSDVSSVAVQSGALLSLGASETIGSLGGDGSVDLGAFFLLHGGTNESTTFSGAISGGGGLVKAGSGVFTLTGANTYSGGTVIAGGTIRVENDQALGSGAVTTTGSTLDYADGVDIGNDIVLMSFPNLNVDLGAAVQSGDISESGGSFGILKTGAGQLTLSGTNTYTGATVVEEGALILAGGAAISDVGIVAVDAGGALYLASSETIGALAGAGGVDLGANILSLAGPSFFEFSGEISGAGGLSILAGGAIELSGANLYSGGTTNEGTLVLSANGAAGSGAIVNNSALLISDDLSNDISGSGFVRKFDAGFAELTGANTHTGGTIVEAGTLRAGLGNLGTGQLSLMAGSRFELNQSADATLDIAVVGDAASVFAQMGGATITYDSGQFGDLDIVDGVANVTGVIAANGPNGMTIFSGSTLTGDGVIVGDVTNAGLVSPGGDSIAVLSIQGDYIHEDSGVLRIQFDPSGAIDLLNVSGTATIQGGTLELLSLGGADGTGLTFLAAGGGMTGTFDSITAPAGGAVGVLYTGNAAQIAATAATVRPSTSNSQVALIEQSTDELLDTIGNQLEQGDNLSAWGGAMFGEIARDQTGASLGYEVWTSGRAAGFRTKRRNGFAFGGAIAQSDGEATLDSDAGQTDLEGLMGAAYGDWSNDQLTIAAGVTLGEHDIETRRRVLLNAAPVDIAGETDSKTVGLYVGATAWFEVGGWSLTASGRLNYLMTTISSYEEQGSSILRLRFSESETEALVARGRLRAERRIRLGDNLAVTPSLSAGLISQGAGGDRNRDATFVSTGVPIALDLDDANRMLGESRLGFAFELGDSFEIDAHGAYLNGDGQSGAYGSVTARFRF